MTRMICITLQWIGVRMTDQEGEFGLAAPGLTARAMTAEELAGQAHRLGRQHRSAPIAPFGDVEVLASSCGIAGGAPSSLGTAAWSPAPGARSS
jgi:hypothetical protein